MSATLYPPHPILLVDDEPHALASFDIALRSQGINNTIRCNDSREVAGYLKNNDIEVVLLDLMMPHVSGQEILADIMHNYPDIPTIIVTGVNEVESAVESIRNGAFDYVLKPVEIERLLPSIKRALEIRSLRRENSQLNRRFFSDALTHPEVFKNIITCNEKMNTLFRYCEAIAEGQQPVLISGETGVGKESISQAVHDLSGKTGQYVTVNVAGLDSQVFTDTLFGHSKGAFTGADRPRPGLVEKAAGGSLFLDEIGDLDEVSQVKLLRFLEEREYYPLGSDLAKKSDARVIVATHCNLEDLRDKGKFRPDLYYRLRTHCIRIPPLRERKDDIPLLLDHFTEQAAKEFNKKKPTYPKELVNLLKGYHFPGNVRELKAMVYDAVSNHQSKMLSMDLFKKTIIQDRSPQSAPLPKENGPLQLQSWATQLEALPTLKDATQTLIEEALKRSENNQRTAAMMLGISPQALSQRLKRQN
ncbi:MAG TPA: sigma-54-dependent Fis family transcriptional regulator [Deltaproteobacteria bacterium]|nr:sigma-54-dependent Fis family transcriptional regulator [Deltaproteobacteria bacterium]